MPIRPNYSIDPGLSLGAAFATGRGNRQQMRDEFRLKQAQMAEQQRQFNMSLFANQQNSQQGMQFDAARQQQQNVADQVMANQAFQNRMALGEQNFKNQGILNQNRDERQGQMYEQRDFRAANMDADSRRAELETYLGGYDGEGKQVFRVDDLTEKGQEDMDWVRKQLDILDQKRASGSFSQRPDHYNQALNRVVERAQKLRLPGSHIPQQPGMEEQIKAGIYTAPDGSTWGMDRNDKPVQKTPPVPAFDKRIQEMTGPAIIDGVLYLPLDGGKVEAKTREDFHQTVAGEAKDMMDRWKIPSSDGMADATFDYAARDKWVNTEVQRRWEQATINATVMPSARQGQPGMGQPQPGQMPPQQQPWIEQELMRRQQQQQQGQVSQPQPMQPEQQVLPQAGQPSRGMLDPTQPSRDELYPLPPEEINLKPQLQPGDSGYEFASGQQPMPPKNLLVKGAKARHDTFKKTYATADMPPELYDHLARDRELLGVKGYKAKPIKLPPAKTAATLNSYAEKLMAINEHYSDPSKPIPPEAAHVKAELTHQLKKAKAKLTAQISGR